MFTSNSELTALSLSEVCRHCRHWDMFNVKKKMAQCKRARRGVKTMVDDTCIEFSRRRDPDDVMREGR